MVTASQLEKIKALVAANPYLIPEINLDAKQKEKFLGNYYNYFLSRKIKSTSLGFSLNCSSHYINVGMISPQQDYRGKYAIKELEETLYSVLRSLYRAEKNACPDTDICPITGGHDGHDREWVIELYIAISRCSEKSSVVGWSSWCDIESVWNMSVIWVHPFIRRGFIKQNWQRWQEMYRDFRVQDPFSVPMIKALKQVDYE